MPRNFLADALSFITKNKMMSFAKLKIIKTHDLHASLSQERLNKLVVICNNKD